MTDTYYKVIRWWGDAPITDRFNTKDEAILFLTKWWNDDVLMVGKNCKPNYAQIKSYNYRGMVQEIIVQDLISIGLPDAS